MRDGWSGIFCLRSLLSAGLVAWSIGANAQPTGLLYDPEPPADSAYVRVIFAAPEGVVDVWVDGRSRVLKLAAGQASDYMVLTAGKHTISLHPAGKPLARVSTTLDIVQGRANSVAYTSFGADSVPMVLEDKANSNKLKATLTAYHLAPRVAPLDVWTADGKTRVFAGLAHGKSASLQVNPISIELIATLVGEQAAKAQTTLVMSQGATYSVLLLAGAGGKLVAKTVQNKIERYTGK